MDTNTATVIVGVVTAVCAIVPSTIAAIYAVRANNRSQSNAVTLEKVSKQTDGLLSQALASAQEIATARELIARHEGGDVERKAGNERALAVLAAMPVGPLAPTEVSIVDATVTVPVEVKEPPK